MSKALHDTEMWKAACLQAVYEDDGEKITARPATAHTITKRLGALAGSSNHHAERRHIRAAVDALPEIEQEAIEWDT
jgi:hypothetical protein